MVRLFACGLVFGLAGGVSADVLDLTVGGVVRDNNTTTASATPVADREAQLRNVLTRADRRSRAFFEFDLANLGGNVVQSATITSGVFSQDPPGASVAPAAITYFVYGADGVLDTGDYDNFFDGAVDPQTIGQITRPDGLAGWSVDLSGTDITAAVQGIVDGGFTHVGFGALLDPSANFTATGLFLRQLDIDVVAVPAPGVAVVLMGGMLVTGRRRR